MFSCKKQLPSKKNVTNVPSCINYNDHRFLAVFDSHQELCVPDAGLCFFNTMLCLSCVKLFAIFVVTEVCVIPRQDFWTKLM